MSIINSRHDLIYYSTKTWEHAVSTAFRQHKANSHCKWVHGYALTFRATFGAYELDERNWVVDFGSLKPFKRWLEKYFDHKLLIANDDPDFWNIYQSQHESITADVLPVEATGCEAIARMSFEWLEVWLQDNGYSPRCWVHSLEVSEHAGNSAIVQRTSPPARTRDTPHQEDPLSRDVRSDSPR
jgi:6-pyruvoyltetrahydropterin/6-carboxytetrahydropterin synthase